MSTTFEQLGVAPEIIEGLRKVQITIPTAIQSAVIPHALNNEDIMGQSVTASGKTLAFLIPLFHKIDVTRRETQGIILAPTQELALQIQGQIELLAKNSGIAMRSVTLTGQMNITRQLEKLKEKPHIVVGSAARIHELILKKKIPAHLVKTIVIDECDKMLDKQNIEGVEKVIKTTQRDRQLMIFSATITAHTEKIATEMMKVPTVQRISEGPVSTTLSHMYFLCDRREKTETLRSAIAALKPTKAIVFVNRPEQIENVASKLLYHNMAVKALYKNADKQERKSALESFILGKSNILVSSDLSARGMDIPNITHIFNMDMPETVDEYLHRGGRSGRNQKPGTVVSIVSEPELPFIKKAERTLKIQIPEKSLTHGKVIDAPEKDPVSKDSAPKSITPKTTTAPPTKEFKHKK